MIEQQVQTWAEIPLRNKMGEVVAVSLVDPELEVVANLWGWRRDSKGYACYGKMVEGKFRVIFLHRFLWEFKNGPIPEGLQIDHINGDRTDNRLGNLRMVTHRQNQQNLKCHREGTKTSSFLGVRWVKNRGRWRADIKYRGKSCFLGNFLDEYEAHLAYQAALERIERGEHPRDNSSRDSQAPSSPL